MYNDKIHDRKIKALAAASGRWRDIFSSAGIPASYLSGKAGPCPLCGGRDRFVFDDKYGHGNYFCRQCGPSDGFGMLDKWLDCGFMDALAFVESYCCIVPEAEDRREVKDAGNEKQDEITPERRARRRMMQLWADARPVAAGDAVDLYLRGRGLDPAKAGFEVRCHTGLEYRDDEGAVSRHPAMLSRVTDGSGCVINIHRTYLTEDGHKADVDKVKKLMPSPVKGACVRLGGMPGDTLGLAEGIETALAVTDRVGFPVWATLGCNNLEDFEAIPDSVKTVHVFADNDGNYAGQAAAYALARSLSAVRHLQVRVHVPEQAGHDWLDEAGRLNDF